MDTPCWLHPKLTNYLAGFAKKKVHNEQNAVKGTKRPRCNGDEAMGKVNCRDCMEGRNEQSDRKGLATQQRDRARLMYAKRGAGQR